MITLFLLVSVFFRSGNIIIEKVLFQLAENEVIKINLIPTERAGIYMSSFWAFLVFEKHAETASLYCMLHFGYTLHITVTLLKNVFPLLSDDILLLCFVFNASIFYLRLALVIFFCL